MALFRSDILHNGSGSDELLIEAVVGWRGWSVGEELRGRIDSDDGTVKTRLKSPHLEGVWHRGELEWDGVCECDEQLLAEDTADDLQLEADNLLYALYAIHDGDVADATKLPAWTAQLLREADGDYEAAYEAARLVIERTRRPQDSPLCQCGINAFLNFGTLQSMHYHDRASIMAFGEVELTGRVRVFERGYRADKGVAKRVWATSPEHAKMVEAACRQAGVEYAGVFDDAATSLS